MALYLNLGGCFRPVIFLRPPAIPQLVEEGLTDGRDVRELVVFENPSADDPTLSIRDLLYLFLNSETLDVLRCGRENCLTK